MITSAPETSLNQLKMYFIKQVINLEQRSKEQAVKDLVGGVVVALESAVVTISI